MEKLIVWLIIIAIIIYFIKYGKPLEEDSEDTTTDWNRENDIRDFY